MSVLYENNTLMLFLKVFIGLMMSYFFYNYVAIEFEHDTELLFKWYMKGAFICAVIGLIQFVSYQINFVPGYEYRPTLNKWSITKGGNFGIRVNSIFAEPTHLGAVLSAAFFVSVYNLIRKESYYINKVQSACIVIVYILSFSGLGQIGIFLTMFLLAISFGLVRYLIILLPVGLLVFNYLHNNVRDFRDRYDSLIDLFTNGHFVLGKTHGSSFILYNNFVVAFQNFKSHFLFGTGIGSHPIAFEKYSLAKDILVEGFSNNSADANSMFLRLVSETGLFGVSIFLYITFKCYIKKDEHIQTNHWLISNGILIMILLNLFRQGHYFLNGFPFFMILYYYNYRNYNEYIAGLSEVKTEEQRSEQDPVTDQGHASA